MKARSWHLPVVWLWVAASLGAISVEGRRLGLDLAVQSRLNQFWAGSSTIVLPALIFVYVRRISLWPAVVGSAGLLLFSTLPALLIYPVVPTMMGMFATLSLFAYVIVAVVLVTFRRAVTSTFSLIRSPNALDCRGSIHAA